ncbi:uncharacterized protein KY384_003944 [Bacidia gigantensis]|uniref:uncharacterized protein n=1 Tax=Bacidia gigantensis TaxID=2732470 RepID=UPI001D03BE77|nr:uncharacterized protein KY384_003944 [Bacidia gigantensis]KAG8532303.1 hypothetical protein KY384_003944 [Bacidia gigantensis]
MPTFLLRAYSKTEGRVIVIAHQDETPFYNIDTAIIDPVVVLNAAIERAFYRLNNDDFVPWKFHPRDSDFEPHQPPYQSPNLIQAINVTQQKPDPVNVFKAETGEVDESYGLDIDTAGNITIIADSILGLLHGLTTVTQLFYTHSSGGVYTPYAPISILDSPSFPHRGLNLDIARNWYPPDEIKRVLEALSWNKFNRLHLHATDAQSWPLEIPSLPLLASKGAYAPSLTYSPATLADLHKFALYRGIQLTIEIDMPGHTAAIAHAFPDLITAPDILPDWPTYSAEPPTGQLKLNYTPVTTFLSTLWSDLLPRLAPFTSTFHTGGDEVNRNAYLLQPDLHTNDTAILQPLIQSFTDTNHAAIRAAGLTPIVWEEMVLDINLTLPLDTIVQTWGSIPNSTALAVEKGYRVIAGDYNSWYLDCGRGSWLDNIPGSKTALPWPYVDYCTPVKNWRTIYAFDPLDGVPANLTHLVLGGEVSLWSEQTDPGNVDEMLWPRAGAAAEILWRGGRDEQGMNRSQVEASPRLAEWRERMLHRGVRGAPVQMVHCTMETGACEI